MNHIGLFEGIGGFSLAARWMGWDTIAWVEWNEFCKKILTHHFPKAKQHGNIKETDFSIYRGLCDILTGGFPCQPYSQAGKRLGKEDDRHLWPEMLRAIREIQPSWVVGENVSGLLNWNGGLVLNEIKTDLESAGFEIFPPCVLPACGINAPHRRDRVWIVAYSQSARAWKNIGRVRGFGNGCSEGIKETVFTANSDNARANNGSRVNTEWQEENKGRQEQPQFEHREDGCNGSTSNANNKGLQGSKEYGGFGKIGEIGNEQLAGFIPPGWENFPTQPPLCGRNDGISNRVDRIKALGNAIVPTVALQIFKAIEQFNLTKGAR